MEIRYRKVSAKQSFAGGNPTMCLLWQMIRKGQSVCLFLRKAVSAHCRPVAIQATNRAGYDTPKNHYTCLKACVPCILAVTCLSQPIDLWHASRAICQGYALRIVCSPSWNCLYILWHTFVSCFKLLEKVVNAVRFIHTPLPNVIQGFIQAIFAAAATFMHRHLPAHFLYQCAT